MTFYVAGFIPAFAFFIAVYTVKKKNHMLIQGCTTFNFTKKSIWMTEEKLLEPDTGVCFLCRKLALLNEEQ